MGKGLRPTRVRRVAGVGVTDGQGGIAMIVVIDREGALLPPLGSDPGSGVRLGLAELGWLVVRAGGESVGVGVPVLSEDRVRQLEHEIAVRGWAAAPRGTEPLVDESVSSVVGPATGPLELSTPLALVVTSGGFVSAGHDGNTRVCLGARELASIVSYAVVRDLGEAIADQARRLGPGALDDREFGRLVVRLLSAGLLVPMDEESQRRAEGRAVREFRRGMVLVRRRREAVDRTLERLGQEEARRERLTGRVRTKVVPVNSEGMPLLSLGLMLAHAAAVDGGRLSQAYQFVPDWCDRTVPALTGGEPPAIYLFSNYIWSHAWNVARSAEVKAKSPHSLTVHGGPNTPKYAADVDTFFAMNPHVDIAVHGEGEATFAAVLDALQGRVGDGPPRLSVLRDVPGLTFRDGQEIVHTGKRDRIADLDGVPSPYLTGLFDSVGDVETTLMTIETNRGCPYGCTFCDWGSATLSRIRKFDLDRVFDELEWCAKHKVRTIFCADANFGIFPRDVDIARKVVELKEKYGYPVVWESSYAKNTVKHLREIIEILTRGGVLSTGTLSLQSVDQPTLDAIKRSNIKVEKYDDLAVEFAKQGLPLVVELMMGLPGSTLASFIGDLQQTIDREVKARANPTEVLMNSPMNAPDYKEHHQIETLRPVFHDWTTKNGVRKKALVISTSSFTRQEYDRMERYRLVFLLSENFGVLRQVSRFVRQEAELPEMDFYARLADDVDTQPSRWPTIAFTLNGMMNYMVPPVSWQSFVDEIGDYLVNEIGIPQSSALDCVLAVQHALLPSPDRSFPYKVILDHDYAAWHQEMLTVKQNGAGADWPSVAPRLSGFGPGVFEVEDPQAVCEYGFGMSLLFDADSDWELGSPVARPMRYRHTVYG
jgi:radical SAM superfamily enzyme YgiQ (UPF0313 family)